ncbi:MAG TPA: hypothetical protein VNW46_00520, partial [Gemmatimonadaceae bacterium]|nr:hypothetical protein [Gemmatimonadaceae bacterium]
MRGKARPVSLFEAADGDLPFTAETSRVIAERVLGFVSAPTAIVTVDGASTGFTEFAGNAVIGASDTRYATVGIMTGYGARSAGVTTTRLDDASLQAAVAKAESLAARTSVDESDVPDTADEPGPPAAINAALWHARALDNLEPGHRIDVVRRVLGTTERAGLVGAGVVGMSARSVAVLTSHGHFEYGRTSTSECTVT